MEKNLNTKSRIVINEGSSRSGKTFNLMIMFCLIALREKCLITIARKTLPAVKASAYRDFLEIITTYNLYNPNNHNKSELSYKLGQGELEFISVDDYNKIKGRKRDYLFCNEANELSRDEFTQLALRTTKRIWLDYNPSHPTYHWIETDIKKRDDINVLHSTYKDNPFLDQATIKEIERLKTTDENLWRIYGLGLIGISKARVYSDWQLIDKLPDNYHSRLYGLDFGYNHPNALAEIREQDDDFYIQEKIYKRFQTIDELLTEMNILDISKKDFIYADSAYPAYIRQIREAGYRILPAKKEAGSVKAGINLIKSKKIHLTKDSINFDKEYRAYSYPLDDNGEPDEREPVKAFDDGMDAIRYGIYSIKTKPFIGVL